MKGIKQSIIVMLVMSVMLGSVSIADAKAPSKKSAAAISQPVNINTADAKALAALPGISTNRANAIIAYREQHGAFKTVDDLANVHGISHRYVEKHKQHLNVG